MRKTTVVFSEDQWNRLSTIAHREHRFPKQQIEFWVMRALGCEASDGKRTERQPAKSGTGASAPVAREGSNP